MKRTVQRLAVRRVDPTCGYGNVAEGIVRGMTFNGVDVVDWNEPAPALLHILPPHFIDTIDANQQRWLLSMWESSSCPEGLRAGFGNFDGIFVPTSENASAWSEYHPNVHRIDMGVDWRFWTPEPDPDTDGRWRVIYTAHSPRRKGGDVCQRVAERACKKGYDIELIPARGATDEDLRALYATAHVYLQLSRGEGWGMMPHQALAMGIPSIITDAPGHREYSWLPGCVMTPTTEGPSPLGFHGDAGTWCEPDEDAALETLMYVLDNYARARRLAAMSPELCRHHYDWNVIAQKITDTIGCLGQEPRTPSWTPAKFTLFPVTPIRSMTCDIGEHRYAFENGVEVMVPADVKRVMREAGYLELLDPLTTPVYEVLA